MAHDAFISYSSKDKPIADGICANLETAGLRCWIAPRDISPGDDFPMATAKAIAASRVMVLVFSGHSNSSEQVSRELFLAANSKMVIIPFRIENVKPAPGNLFYLGSMHWLDAMNPPTQAQINQLVKRVESIIKTKSTADKDVPVLSPSMLLDFRQPLHRKLGWGMPAAALLVGAALIITGIILLPKLRAASQSESMQILPLSKSLLTAGQPMPIYVPQNQATPSPLPPGSPPFYLYRQDFTDDRFDGAFPPDVQSPEERCSNLKVVQEKGSLTFQSPANAAFMCSVKLTEGYKFFLGEIKAVEFAISTSPETSINHASFDFMLVGDYDQKHFFLICGLTDVRSGCNVRKDQLEIYQTKTVIAKPGVSYMYRIEVLDPDKMTFRFLVNKKMIGEFSMPIADIPAYKDLVYTVGGGPVSTSNTTKAGMYYIDYIAIEKR